MRGKIIYAMNALWTGIMAFTFPICLAIIWMDITGHSKGYGYDLGPEKDISVMMGATELVIWLIAALPAGIYVFRRTARKSRLLACAAGAVCVMLSLVCILMIGGWGEYVRAFGL